MAGELVFLNIYLEALENHGNYRVLRLPFPCALQNYKMR